MDFKFNFIKKLFTLLPLLIIYLNLSVTNGVTIMSVDFGSEWMKIAVVAPGIPMEIALNKESKRKTPVAIAFRDGERTFGDEALAAGMKKPSSSYAYLLDLLGKKADSPMVDIYKQRFPYYDLEADSERDTVVFRKDANTTFSVEELVAQVLNNARELAASYTNQKIKDLVITVPPYFNQVERRALLAAAELANLKVLALMSSNAAVALNYGMFRRKEINETAQNILFYDMGASSTTVSITSYQTIKTKDKGYTETNPQVTILGLGYDRTLGGVEMQLRLRDFLAKKFNEMKKTSNDVFKSPRSMGKLMKEAGKLKMVLSANMEHISQVEGVLDDMDFRLKVTRQDFEELCGDLFARVTEPIDSALVSAGIDLSEIHQFIIVGGNTRVPKIQSLLQTFWGKELGKNINTDEAAALGAVYRAADLGQGYKVMKFHVKESVVLPIEVDFERQVQKDDGTLMNKVFKRNLFARPNTYPQKKVMTFNKHTGNFGFSVNYGDLGHLNNAQIKNIGITNISYIMVEGVNEAFKKNLDDGCESKGIKAHFSMDDSGLLLLSNIEALFEKNVTVEVDKEEESTLSKIGSTLSKLFSGNEEEKEQSEDKSDENKTEDKKNSKTGKKDKNESKKKTDTKDSKKAKEEEKSKTDKEDTKDKKEKEVKAKLVTIKEELTFRVVYLDIKDMTEDSIENSKKKIESINGDENARKEMEHWRNNLESYILDVQDKLTIEEYEAASLQNVRDDIISRASKLDEWLYDEGFNQEASVYKQKLKSLEKLFEPIKARVREHQERPEALKALHDMINASSTFLYRAKNSDDLQKYFTDVELKSLDELIINTQKFIETKEEEQENTPAYEEPKLTLYSVAEKIQALDREIKYLINKGKMAKAKMDKEIAEAKAKELAEILKAEKEAKKKLNETLEMAKNNATVEEEEKQTENIKDGDSRKEPSMPTEDEEEPSVPVTEENEGESNRRKNDDDLEDSSSTVENKPHIEL